LTESRQYSGECCCEAQLPDPSGRAAIDATFFDRQNASKHYCRRTNYRVQTLKTTALVDTETQAILDVHCTTEKRHDTQLCWQVARPNVGTSQASLPTKATTGWIYARNSERIFDRFSNSENRPLVLLGANGLCGLGFGAYRRYRNDWT
jgi:IS5 family transposase